MAVVTDPRFRALDASGNAYVGATLTVYTAGTTTPASIYHDAALSSPMTNPTSGADKSDANGYFPQVFCAASGLFDILVKDSGGATLSSLVNVPALGSATGGISLDLTGSRFKVSNSGGTVEIETGDATGDDSGGTMRMGGWAGTQGDSGTLDYALLNVTGIIKEGSKKIPGIVYTEGTFAAATNIDIALPNIPVGVQSWQLDMDNLVSSGTSTLTFRFSFDNGVTYVSAADYLGVHMENGSATTYSTTTSGTLATSLSTAVTAPGTLSAIIRTPNSGASQGSTIAGTAQGGNMVVAFSGSYFNGDGRATNIRIIAGTALTGKFRLIPRRGLGE